MRRTLAYFEPEKSLAKLKPFLQEWIYGQSIYLQKKLYQQTITRKTVGYAFRLKARENNSAKHDPVSMSSLDRR